MVQAIGSTNRPRCVHPTVFRDARERAERVVRKNRLSAEYQEDGCGDGCICEDEDVCRMAVDAVQAAILLAIQAYAPNLDEKPLGADASPTDGESA